MNISLRNKINGRGLQLFSDLGKKTARIHMRGLEHAENLRASGKPVLWTTWHGQTMMLAIMFQQKLKGLRLMLMIPDDWRGESLYFWTKRIGMHPRPMDLENKGLDTARKIARLVKNIRKDKYDNFLAPDGPAGPSHQVKPGIIYMAQKLGAPILPIGAYARHKYSLPRWDAYALPLPFSRIDIIVGEPLELPKAEPREKLKEKITNALHRVTMQAKASYYEARNED